MAVTGSRIYRNNAFCISAYPVVPPVTADCFCLALTHGSSFSYLLRPKSLGHQHLIGLRLLLFAVHFLATLSTQLCGFLKALILGGIGHLSRRVDRFRIHRGNGLGPLSGTR